jgi:hypothetical protein
MGSQEEADREHAIVECRKRWGTAVDAARNLPESEIIVFNCIARGSYHL